MPTRPVARYTIFGIVFCYVLWSGSYLFTQAGQLLVRNDAPYPRNSLAVILMGHVVPRAEHAASLLRAGTIGKAIFFATETTSLEKEELVANDGILTKQYLDKNQIAADRLLFISNTHIDSTIAEAKQTLKWLKSQGQKPSQIIVITSWYHSSRAGWIFEKIFAGSGVAIKVSPAFGANTTPEQWWQQEQSFLNVFNEYIKWIYYLLHYS